MAKWTSEYIASLPDSAFAFIAADGTRHLPFKNAEGRVDLPHVRNALARLDQVSGMSASEKSAAKDKLQGSLKASDADDDVMTSVHEIKASAEDTDGDGLPTRMMLLRQGVFNTSKYGEVPLSASDLQEMADNFHNGIGMAGDGSTGIPVDYAHHSHLNAAAWIKDVAVEDGETGKELWATSIEWSGSGKKAIQDKEYKCLSSDFYPAAFGQWVDAESGVSAKNVIVGAALTNRPMFSGNTPVVQASDARDGERQIVKYVIADEKENSMNIDHLRVKAADDVTGAEQRFLQAHASELSAEERQKFEIVDVQASDENKQPTKVEASSIKGNEGLVAIEASEIKSMRDQITGLQASEEARTKATLAGEVDKAIARGAIKADRKDSWVNRLVASSEADRTELLADLNALADNPVLAKEQGSANGDSDEQGGADARAQLMAHATDLMKTSAREGKAISIIEATALAKEQHPELVEAAAASRQALLSASDAQFAAAGINRG